MIIRDILAAALLLFIETESSPVRLAQAFPRLGEPFCV